MPFRKILVCTLLPFISQLTAWSQSSLYSIGEISPWVQQQDFNPDYRVSDTTGDGGISYLLIDRQLNTETKERYTHFAFRITNQGGLHRSNEHWVNYDPSYQTVIFHKTNIVRKGRNISVLDLSKIKEYSNEPEMDHSVYTGEKKVGQLLEGLKVNDIVEFAYTVKGNNPALQGRYFTIIEQGVNAPLARLHYRLIMSRKRKVHFRNFQGADDPVRRSLGRGLMEYTWDIKGVNPSPLGAGTPDRFISYPYVQVSEFAHWKEVAAWATGLFPFSDTIPLNARELLQGLLEGKEGKDATLRAITDFVQNEIRYVAREMGASAYRPHSPAITLHTRFGDCKDKAYLLAVLLRTAGIKADVALVSTILRDDINEHLPSPTLFDHAIVTYLHKGERYWIDATLPFQGGPVTHRLVHDYGLALIADNKEDGLKEVISRSKEEVMITERYSAGTLDKPATFFIVSENYGGEADRLRAHFHNVGIKEIEESYVNFYAHYYPGIKSIGLPTYQDNADSNIFTVSEQYEIPAYWSTLDRGGGSNMAADIQAMNVYNFMTDPKDKNRKTPLKIYHPVSITQKTYINHLKGVAVDPYNEDVYNDVFEFSYRSENISDTSVLLLFTYQTLKDEVSVDEMEDYFEDLADVRQMLRWSFPYNSGSPQQTSFNWSFLYIAIILLIFLAIGFRKLYRLDYGLVSTESNPRPFGGWLVLLMVGVVLTPIFLLAQINDNGFFELDQWQYVWKSSSAGYSIKTSLIVLLEFVMNVILFGGSIFLILLMFRRRVSFPVTFVVFRIISLVFSTSDYLLTYYVLDNSSDNENKLALQVIIPLITAGIWIPYMLYSERVAETFIYPYGHKRIRKNRISRQPAELHSFGRT